MSQTRDKKPKIKQDQPRSYSSIQPPKIEFKESIIIPEKLIKKPSNANLISDEKMTEKNKLKTIFEASESLENRSKSHTDISDLKRTSQARIWLTSQSQ